MGGATVEESGNLTRQMHTVGVAQARWQLGGQEAPGRMHRVTAQTGVSRDTQSLNFRMEITVLSETTHTQKDKYYIFSLIYKSEVAFTFNVCVCVCLMHRCGGECRYQLCN